MAQNACLRAGSNLEIKAAQTQHSLAERAGPQGERVSHHG